MKCQAFSLNLVPAGKLVDMFFMPVVNCLSHLQPAVASSHDYNPGRDVLVCHPFIPTGLRQSISVCQRQRTRGIRWTGQANIPVGCEHLDSPNCHQ